ncbi:MAG: hypothetical protein NUV77_22725, partial [Thermoguttaceae bacterium]|nr:hypothetical protein [Thermoguttaceae bacterium]
MAISIASPTLICATGQQEQVFRGHGGAVSAVAFSPDGREVLTGSMDGTAILWDAQTGHKIRTFVGHRSGIFSAVFHPSGEYILTGSIDTTAILWNKATG